MEKATMCQTMPTSKAKPFSQQCLSRKKCVPSHIKASTMRLPIVVKVGAGDCNATVAVGNSSLSRSSGTAVIDKAAQICAIETGHGMGEVAEMR